MICNIPLNIIETIFDYHPQIYWLNEVLKEKDWKHICLNEVHLENDENILSFLSLVKEKPPLKIKTLDISNFTCKQANIEKVIQCCDPVILQDLDMSYFYHKNDVSHYFWHLKIKEKISNHNTCFDAFYNLTSLNIGSSERTTDETLKHISHMKHLTYLGVGDCRNITCHGFQHLSSLKKLETLNMSSCSAFCSMDVSLMHLCSLTKLKHLYLSSNTNITFFIGLNQLLPHLINLESLDVSNCDGVINTLDFGLQNIGGLSKLTSLNLGKNELLTNEGLKNICHSLKPLSDLKEIILNKCEKITDVSSLTALKQIHTLDLSFCDGVVNFHKCGQMTQLTSLSLVHTNMTNEEFQQLSSLKQLVYLKMDGFKNENITDEALAVVFSSLTNLTFLTLTSCSITDVGVKHISDFLTKLTQLNLDYCLKITDVGVKHIASSLINLTNLGLYHCNVSDIGLHHISFLKKLSYLHVENHYFPRNPKAFDLLLKNNPHLKIDIFMFNIFNS